MIIFSAITTERGLVLLISSSIVEFLAACSRQLLNKILIQSPAQFPNLKIPHTWQKSSLIQKFQDPIFTVLIMQLTLS